MAGAAEQVDLSGLAAALARLGRLPADMTPTLRAVAVYARSVSLEAFDRAADPTTGAAWAPLKASTVKRRRGGGKGARPLLDTGLMRLSVTGQTDGMAVIQGSNLPRARYHQRGTKTIPARPFLGFGPRHLDVIAKMVADAVVREMANKSLTR